MFKTLLGYLLLIFLLWKKSIV